MPDSKVEVDEDPPSWADEVVDADGDDDGNDPGGNKADLGVGGESTEGPGATTSADAPPPRVRRPKHPPLPVLAEGDGWIVVAKPPRVVVHRTPQMRRVSAVLQRVRAQVGRRVHLIHRLDRGTSGCLLLATRTERAGELSRALNADTSRKTYLAFVRGWFPHEEPVFVENPVKTPHGYKASRSRVELLGRSHEPRCSLLRVRPETGRHHQVRRHVRDLHHPVIGDGDHGDSRVNRWWRERGVDRLGLHCAELQVEISPTERIDVRCPLYADQAEAWRTLPWWEDALALEPVLGLEPFSMDWMYPIA